jgi:hypothetical protein
VQSSFPLSRACCGLSIVPIVVFETCGPAKLADISLNTRCIFVRARVGGPTIGLIPKRFRDERRRARSQRKRRRAGLGDEHNEKVRVFLGLATHSGNVQHEHAAARSFVIDNGENYPGAPECFPADIASKG